MKNKTIDYRHDNTDLEGYAAWDGPDGKRRPGVLVIHEWMGISPHERHSCDELARAGYLGFAADIFGKHERPKNVNEAIEYATRYRAGERAMLRARAQAGLAALRAQPMCDPDRLAVIGFCFGGTAALELARSGAALQATVSFHGGLGTERPQDARQIKGAVLALHGANDPFVSKAEVDGFEDEMRQANVDWRIVKYGNAVHNFTNPQAGNDVSKGAAYDRRATERGWRAMLDLFTEVFA
ncbi:MAG: dienelactone hydrolase family protein [Acidiferrobacterales bacterium]